MQNLTREHRTDGSGYSNISDENGILRYLPQAE